MRALGAVVGGSNRSSSGVEVPQVDVLVGSDTPSPHQTSPSICMVSTDCVLIKDDDQEAESEKEKKKKKSYQSETMPDDANRGVGRGDENNQAQEHPVPPPFNPVPSSHATSTHVHSVVPDLMRVYESLTNNGNPGAHDGQSNQLPPHPPPPPPPQHQQQDPTYYQQQQNQQPQGQVHVQPPAPQHVSHTYIQSEEEYRQVYQRNQASGTQDPNQIQNQQFLPSSLPYIPAPYESPAITEVSQPRSFGTTQQATVGPEKAGSSEESNPRPSSRSSSKRKRNSATQQQQQEETSSSTTSGKSKGRKKAKETDGRWSKRFTWPEELHRDFVSAVFDVGLKHSSPSTILEHMPKHPQITSERVKSHLQKYRVHRTKSKQEFMSSYESTLKKFKAGDMDNVKALSNGEAGAHLTHSVLTDTTLGPTGSTNSTSRESKNSASHQHPQPGAPQTAAAAAAPPPLPPAHQRVAPPQPGHEALMLPKLTEAEKASPIGASMGYLLGLFFSLKKQLLVQRAANPSSGPAPASANSAIAPVPPAVGTAPSGSNGPVAAVYSSFVGSPVPTSGGNPPPQNVVGIPNPTTPPTIGMAPGIDWPSSNPPAPPPQPPAPPPPAISTVEQHHGLAASTPSSVVPNPVLNAGTTRNNLEASNSMMKREMQNQMAFQNKMRALKQQELNKYKNVAPNQNAGNTQQQSEQTTGSVRFKEPDSYAETGGQQQYHHHHHNTGGSPPSTTPAQSNQAAALHHDIDPGSSGIGGTVESSKSPPTTSGGDGENANLQGAGETATATLDRARTSSFSMGGNDDFWNADVMDEQLFEFLMNN